MSRVVDINRAFLRKRPLPIPAQADKEVRGRLLIIAGARDVPGAPVLTAHGALRSGAGKLAVMVPGSIAGIAALSLPESRILSIPPRVTPQLFNGMAAIVIGPGMSATVARRWSEAALANKHEAAMVLDANAIGHLWHSPALRQRRKRGHAGRCIVTPNAGEMADYSGATKESVCDDPIRAAQTASALLGGVVVLKGATTIVAMNDKLFRHRADTPGLAMSGSGDVLAGIIGGLLARGVPPLDASLWGVFLHSMAGQTLGRKMGPIGYRATELPDQIPSLMHALR